MHLIDTSPKRLLQPSQIRCQGGVSNAPLSSNLGENLGAVGHLRDPLRADERCGFDCPAPGGCQAIDQLHLRRSKEFACSGMAKKARVDWRRLGTSKGPTSYTHITTAVVVLPRRRCNYSAYVYRRTRIQHECRAVWIQTCYCSTFAFVDRTARPTRSCHTAATCYSSTSPSPVLAPRKARSGVHLGGLLQLGSRREAIEFCYYARLDSFVWDTFDQLGWQPPESYRIGSSAGTSCKACCKIGSPSTGPLDIE